LSYVFVVDEVKFVLKEDGKRTKEELEEARKQMEEEREVSKHC